MKQKSTVCYTKLNYFYKLYHYNLSLVYTLIYREYGKSYNKIYNSTVAVLQSLYKTSSGGLQSGAACSKSDTGYIMLSARHSRTGLHALCLISNFSLLDAHGGLVCARRLRACLRLSPSRTLFVSC